MKQAYYLHTYIYDKVGRMVEFLPITDGRSQYLPFYCKTLLVPKPVFFLEPDFKDYLPMKLYFLQVCLHILLQQSNMMDIVLSNLDNNSYNKRTVTSLTTSHTSNEKTLYTVLLDEC